MRHSSHPIRRALDFLLPCALLAITLPLLGIVGLAIKADSPSPIFDRQVCLGHHGRRFRLFNLRTIAHDPEGAHPVWAQRVTRMGAFLRRTRIKNLPQLINVVRGEIRLIGNDGRSPAFE